MTKSVDEGVAVDHLVLPALDYEASARFFADVMGLEYRGVDQDAPHFAPVRVSETFTVAFRRVTAPQGQHIGFHVSKNKFAQIQQTLSLSGTPYGNSPQDVRNGRTDHPFGGQGLFFIDANSNLFEIFTEVRGAGT